MLVWFGLSGAVAYQILNDNEQIRKVIHYINNYEATGDAILSEGKTCNE